MTVGNIVALTQVNVKRMLAYSSIAHTGYIMAGLAAYANADRPEIAALGIQSVLFYLLGYAVMNIAAFAVVGHAPARHEPLRRPELVRRPGIARAVASRRR